MIDLKANIDKTATNIKDWEITNSKNILGFPSSDIINQGFLYALEYGDYLKIGRTKNLAQRISFLTYQAINYSQTDTRRIAYSIQHSNYAQNENILHKFFKDKRVGKGELFSLTLDDFLASMPQLTFKKELSGDSDNDEVTDIVNWLLEADYEKITGLPFETFLQWENAKTPEEKNNALRYLEFERCKKTLRKKGFSEKEIQETLAKF